MFISIFSLDLSDEDEDQGDRAHSPSRFDEQFDKEPPVTAASSEEPMIALNAARNAVVEDLQCLLRSMQSAVDDQVLFCSVL